MKTNLFMFILIFIYLVEGDTLFGSSLNNIKTLQLNQPSSSKIKVIPNQEIIIEINSQQSLYKIELDISSTGTYQICTLNSKKQCTKNYVRHSKKENLFSFDRQQITYGIKIKNPSDKKKIKIVINYHIQNQQCHTLESRVIHRKQLQNQTCFLFQLNKQQDVQLVIIKQQALDLKYYIQICGNQFRINQQNFSKNKFKISFFEIIKHCKASTTMTLKIHITHQQQSNKNGSQCTNHPQIGLILEYLQQSLIIPEGIAYISSFVDHLNAKILQYELINKQNTTINVVSDLSLEIYVKIVQENQKDKTIPNKNNYDFSSKTGYIFSYFRPYLIITKQVIQKYQCTNCYLIVSLFTSNNISQTDKRNKFSIQITQYSSTLVSGQMKYHFLQASAFAYYTFNSQAYALTVYQLADNNKNCASFYLSDQEVPSPQNYIEKSQKNKIVYKSESNKPIFIGVKAEEDCAYSFSVTTASTQIMTLQKGRFGYLNLLKDQLKYFLIQTTKCQYIKVLSLHVYGSVDIYLNRIDIKGIKQLKKDKIDYKKFPVKGQYMNRLLLSSKEKIFCEGCYYLVAVIARKLTQSTLFYGDQTTPIPIYDKIINDIIPLHGNIIKGQYYGESKFQLQVKVHSGRLKLKINKGEQRFIQKYSKINEITKQVVDLGLNNFLMIIDSVLNLQTIEVQFEALEDNTIYSIRFKSIQEGIIPSFTKLFNQETQAYPLLKIQNYSLQPAHDLYLRITDQKSITISGYYRDSTQKILLSCDVDQSQLFQQLNITLSIGSKNIQYKLQRMRNIITLQVPKLKNYSIRQGIKFKIQISLNVSGQIWVTIMQAEDFQLLSPQIYTHIQNSYTFVTHTQTDLIVQLFECKGKVNLYYASDRQQLEKNQNLTLDIIGFPNQPHAMKIQQLNTTFYKIIAQQAILRWFPFIIQEGVGTGYIKFRAGNLNYDNNLIAIKFNWLSLSLENTKDKTKSKTIQNISYTIYIATTQNTLKQFSQCQPFLISEKQQGIKIENIVDSSQSQHLNKNLSYQVSKKKLINKFGQNVTLFATIVAQLSLSQNITNQKDQKQRYRFIYPQIQIPNDQLHSSYVATIIESNYDQLISAILLVLTAIVISTYLLINKLMPVFGILKNRYFVQENEQIGSPPENVVPSENQNQEVPQSSDRRGIVSTGQKIEVDDRR